MIFFILALGGLIGLTILIQLITKMKIVGGNELGIVSGKKNEKGFRLFSGGRAFIIPLFNKFATLDLTPHTIEVRVDSAIAAGIVPLNVKATVSFAIAGNEAGRQRAATRLLAQVGNSENLRKMAADIIEGHLRDSIASMTPEQVMKDKDVLVAKMINACKNDLENIGLEITTMNIADVDDHRLEGVDEPDLYIALLKRVQTANARTKARVAQAEATASAVEKQEEKRAEIEVRGLENDYENLVATTKVILQQENQTKMLGIEEATRQANAKAEGIKHQVSAEEQNIEMLKKKFEAEIIMPALAQKEKMILNAQAVAVRMKAKAQAEIDQLKNTMELLDKSGSNGEQAYLLEHFSEITGPFAETLGFFPIEKVSVITGASGSTGPISAIHPGAVDENRNALINDAMQSIMNRKPASK